MSKALNLKLDNWVLERLSEPFPVEEVKWLPAFGNRGGVLAYVDARTVTNRLNEVVGAENWMDRYIESTIVGTEVRDITNYPQLVEEKKAEKKGYKTVVKSEGDKEFAYNDIKYGGIRCELTVLEVTKSDVGVPSFAEQLKGAYSDSLKRAAVKFGIGEYFYRLGTLDAVVDYGKVVEPPEMPEWALPIERPSADEVIQSEIEKTLALELIHDDRIEALWLVDHLHSMGRYNPRTPLVVKRAVYEGLLSIASTY